MERRDVLKGMGAASILLLAPELSGGEVMAEMDETVYELRIYHLNEGKLPLILDRFRTKEAKIFERVGMVGVGYWTSMDEPLAGRTLIYMLRHKSRAAADASWARFKDDPEWLALKAETEKEGAFVNKIESTFIERTDFSPHV